MDGWPWRRRSRRMKLKVGHAMRAISRPRPPLLAAGAFAAAAAEAISDIFDFHHRRSREKGL